MQEMIFQIVIVLAVASAGWAVAQLIASRVGGEKRKIKNRLSGEHAKAAPLETPMASRSITVQTDVKGLSAVLARQPVFNALYRALLQTWPEMQLTRFLGITLGCGGMMFIVLGAVFN